MKWFRPATRPHHLALSMVGAKSGDRVLVTGADDGSLAAHVALVTGLNGRTLVLDARPGAHDALDMAAAQAGALVDFAAGTPSAVPEPDAAFDIVVFNRLVGSLPASDRADLCAEALRVLRPGGRLIAVERTRRPLLFGLASTAQTPGASGAQIVALAHHAGFRAARILSESQGLLFVEATKPSLAP